MDAKILTAVFISLAAIFVGANGGMFSTADIRQMQSEAGISSPSVNSIGKDVPFIGKYFRKPKPENEIHAEIKYVEPTEFQIVNAELEADNLNRINARSMKIESNGNIRFRNFNGKLSLSNKSKIRGSATGLKSSGVNISTGIRLKTALPTDQIYVGGTGKIAMSFPKASIGPTNGSDFSLDTERSGVNINSFKGDMLVYPRQKRIVLRGLVDKLEAGKYSLQSE